MKNIRPNKSGIHFFMLMSLFLSFGSCHKSKNQELNLPDITEVQEQEEGFADIRLKIVEANPKGKNIEYLAKGKFENQIVGLKITLPQNLPEGILNGEINEKSFLKKGVTLTTIGQESDQLLHALGKLYQIPTTAKFSTLPIQVTIFSLNEVNADLSKPHYYKFKIFFNDTGDENEYAEMFLNLDLENNFIEWNEKDNEYRKNIIHSLEEKEQNQP